MESEFARKETDRFYAENAVQYAAAGGKHDNPWRERFLGRLASGAAILELGCGGGHDSKVMLERGFHVTPTDGVPEMVAQAQDRLGVPVLHLRFSEITFEHAFDGVFANACLLHASRTELPDILARIHLALKPGGIFYASFKAGEAEGQDGLGRYYNYPDEAWLRQVYERVGWRHMEIDAVHGSGYDRQPTPWLHVLAQA